MRNATDFVLSLAALAVIGIVLFWAAAATVAVTVIVLACVWIGIKALIVPAVRRHSENQEQKRFARIMNPVGDDQTPRQKAAIFLQALIDHNKAHPDQTIVPKPIMVWGGPDMNQTLRNAGDETLEWRDIIEGYGRRGKIATVYLIENGADRLVMSLGYKLTADSPAEQRPRELREETGVAYVCFVATGVIFVLDNKIRFNFDDELVEKHRFRTTSSDAAWAEVTRMIDAHIATVRAQIEADQSRHDDRERRIASFKAPR